MNGQRLTRPRNSMVGGVAAGVAEWINADPALVRIAWALLVPLTGGAALLAYIVAWVVIPEAPAAPIVPAADAAGGGGADPVRPADAIAPPVSNAPQAKPSAPIDEGRTALLIGGGLILLGLWFLVREYLPRIDWSFVWPLVLVAIGVLILVGSTRRR
jgi:phage shock protein C